MKDWLLGILSVAFALVLWLGVSILAGNGKDKKDRERFNSSHDWDQL